MSNECLGLRARIETPITGQYLVDNCITVHGDVNSQDTLRSLINYVMDTVPEDVTIYVEDETIERMKLAAMLTEITEIATGIRRRVNYGRRSDGLHDARTKAISDAMGIVCQYADEASESV